MCVVEQTFLSGVWLYDNSRGEFIPKLMVLVCVFMESWLKEEDTGVCLVVVPCYVLSRPHPALCINREMYCVVL